MGQPSQNDNTSGATPKGRPSVGQGVASARTRVTAVTERAQQTLLWQVYDRLLEIEFVDRSIAIAGKAFVSFFPLIIVVSAFLPKSIHDAVFTTMTHRLGIRGDALVTARQAFSSSDDVRRATGIVGLFFTFFFATSFTTALQRVYLRAWRRPPGTKAGQYAGSTAWFLGIVAYLALLGGLRQLLGEGPQVFFFAIVSLAATTALWWTTAWFMLMRQVRWRVLVPTGLITGIAISGFAL
jgi:membrane protein